MELGLGLGLNFSDAMPRLSGWGVPPYIRYLRLGVTGKISSYNRGGKFKLYPNGTSSTALVYGTDFTLHSTQNIAYSASDLDSFLSGNAPSSNVVPVNGRGTIVIEFTPEAQHKLDRMTIEGRVGAYSTYFSVELADSKGHVIWHKPTTLVTDMVTWHMGVDITPVPATNAPLVLSSTVMEGFEEGIVVTWNKAVQYSANIHTAINVRVNGTAVHPDHLMSDPGDPTTIVFMFPTKFKFGDILSWAYNDQSATEELHSVDGTEALGRSHTVTNEIQDPNNVIGFASAVVLDEHTVEVTLDATGATGASKSDWMVKINNNPATNTNVALSATKVTVAVVENIDGGDLITISHLDAAEGIKQVLDYPVVNSNTVATTAFSSGFGNAFK